MARFLLSLLVLAGALEAQLISGGGGTGGSSTPPAAATCAGPGTSCVVDVSSMGISSLTKAIYKCKDSTGADVPVTSASTAGSPNLTSVTLNWTGSLSSITCAVQAGGSPGANGSNGLSTATYAVTFTSETTKTVTAATLAAAGIALPTHVSPSGIVDFVDDGSHNITLTAGIPITATVYIEGGGAYVDTDATMAANSDSKVASQKAAKAYADAHSGGTSGGASGGDLSGTYPNPTVAKVNGTLVPTNSAADQVLGTTATATGSWLGVPNCGDGTHSLNYNTSTHAFGCQAITAATMVYPGAGVPLSTGSAWGASYTVGTGASNLVQLNGSSQLPAVSAALLTSFPTLNQNTSGTAANLSGTPALPSGTTATTQSQADASTKLATTAYVDTGLGTKAASNASAGGDLSGTYPNPTVKQMHDTVTSINNASSPYTVLAADTYLSCNATAGGVTIVLPAATGTGREISVKKIDSSANLCTLTRAGADTIDGTTSAGLTTQYASTQVIDAVSASWQRTRVSQLGGDLSGVTVNATVAKIGGQAVSLAGSLTTSGANALTITTTGPTTVTLPTAGTLTVTIASGTSALGTSAISSGACATVVTTAATGAATTDTITDAFNADPSAVTGYGVGATGTLTIYKYPTANNVNFKVCNSTSGSITPGAATLNWRIVR